MNLSRYIRSFQGFPKPDVTYRDFTPLLENPDIFQQAIDRIRQHYADRDITHIAAIEAKGFILGSALAYAMHLPLTLIRKPGLIPGETGKCTFIKEYGTGEYQIKKKAFPEGNRFLLVYDILAGGGATKAAIQLLESQKANISGCAYVIELTALSGREALHGIDVFSLVKIGIESEDHPAYAATQTDQF